MDQLKRMAVFAEVVAAGSFSAAARRLAMTPSAVSQHIRQLEAALGLALLHRSTRRLSLTEAGERYYTACAAMVAAAKAADQALFRFRDEPEGELRLAAPIGFSGILATALAPLRQHSKLSLQLLLSDGLIDLIEERVDIALRVGHLADSTLVARKLGQFQRKLCASPQYLAERGHLQQVEDLLKHDWLGGLPNSTGLDTFTLHQGQQSETVSLVAKVQTTQVTTLNALCMAGWGISLLVMSEENQAALACGQIVSVLPDWHIKPAPVYALTQRRTEQPVKVRHTLDLLTDYFRHFPDE